MLRHVRTTWGRVAALLFVILSATTLATSAVGLTQPIVSALAYNCGSGNYNGQKDAFNGTKHGWLGYCNGSTFWFKYYSGEDDAGAVLSQQTIHLRAWSCGNIHYDQSLTTYGTTSIGMEVPWYFDGCGILESDSSGEEAITGQFDWSWYLNF